MKLLSVHAWLAGPVPLALALLPACQTPVSPEEIEAATLYFPPTFKTIDAPRWSLTRPERKRALRDYRDHDGADTLFEIIVDAEGKVVKARLVRTDVSRQGRERMVWHAHKFVFSEDPGGEGFRTFFLPTDYTYASSFQWL